MKAISSIQGGDPDAASRSPQVPDKPASEQAFNELPSAELADKQTATDGGASPRIGRRMRLARLKAVQEKPKITDEQVAASIPAEWQDAISSLDSAPQTSLPQAKLSPPQQRGLPPFEAPAREETMTILPVPQKGRSRVSAATISFILCVILPAVIFGSYFFFYASNQYVSEFKFVVRDARTAAAGVSQSGGLQGLFNVGSASSSPVENYMVADYLVSRPAVDALQAKIDVMSRYSRPDIDWFARFEKDQPIEKFMQYWQRMVSANYDQVTGIGSVQIRAFQPKDAYEIASLMVSEAEKLVNDIANKPQQDAIRFAEADLKRAEERLKVIRQDLSELRNKEQVIDPQSNVVASNILLAQTLRANLSQMQTELSALAKQKLHADAPASQILQSRIKATREQLAVVEGQVGNDRDGATPLSRVVAKFEQMDLERQFAQSMVQSLMQNLEQARTAALTQHVYVTAFISPLVPESSTYPKRLLSTFVAAFVLFIFWLIGLLVVRSVREHLT
jgi:capsular polysaccharide transport system permease protein